MNAIITLTPQQLRKAADIQEQIASLQQELNQILGTGSEITSVAPIMRRKLSAQGLANIRAGARKRWGSLKAGKVGAPRGYRRKNKMSAAGRARISVAIKARWAAARRAGRNRL